MDAITLVSAWNALVLQLCCVFTEPTGRTWQQIVLGWVLNRGPATVTGLFRTLGDRAGKHWTVYQKFFYRTVWSLEALCLHLMVRVVGPLILESGLIDQTSGKPAADLAIDDTTVGRCGRHVAHAGWYKDASATGPSHKGTVIHWAHNWIVGAVTLRLPRWPLLRWVLPVIFALYRKPSDCGKTHPFYTRQELAGHMVQCVAKALCEIQWRISADGQYATKEFVRALPTNVSFVSRIRRDAAIYALPPARRPKSKRGPYPKKGHRLPTPQQMAIRRKKGWKTVGVLRQGRKIKRRVLGITCLWYRVCKDNPVRMVIVRDPGGREDDDFFFCTDANVPDAEIIQRYYDRWGVEETIWEAKQYLGFEDTRGWCSKTVNRQAPLAMILLTLVKVWYARYALNEPSLQPEKLPWYPSKAHPSFQDMLSALRRILWQHRISPNSRFSARVKQIWETVSYALFAA